MEQEKTAAQILTEQVLQKKENVYDKPHCDEAFLQQMEAFCADYKAFLNAGKTEREVLQVSLQAVQKAGFVPFEAGHTYEKGQKVYFNNRDKSLVLVHFGRRSVADGLRIVMAHIDSPRLDLKPQPVTEEAELAFFKTQYYGGIVKYQWPAMPLSLHGVIYRADGSRVTVRIGDDPADPCFTVTDLLPHLNKEEAKKPMATAISAEHLNLLVGSRPFKDDKASERVKLQLLAILKEKYNLCEGDFISAELEAVPAFDARDIGFDRSMIGAYGQDDRVCAYPCLRAMLDVAEPEYTTLCLLCDKEETGSDGNTGLASHFFQFFLEDLAEGQGVSARRMLGNSICLSADVTAAFDPAWPGVHDKNNASFLNHGVSVMKYSGAGGKYSTTDASAETMCYFRRLLEGAGVDWQIGCLGAVDAGGGGTLAKYIADLNIDVLDIGVPLLSMHAPFEVAGKADIYSAYRAFVAFCTADPA